jgi:hypothetical protein
VEVGKAVGKVVVKAVDMARLVKEPERDYV